MQVRVVRAREPPSERHSAVAFVVDVVVVAISPNELWLSFLPSFVRSATFPLNCFPEEEKKKKKGIDVYWMVATAAAAAAAQRRRPAHFCLEWKVFTAAAAAAQREAGTAEVDTNSVISQI